MRKLNKLTYPVAAIIIAVIFIISFMFGGGAAVSHAATSASVKEAYEKRNITDDLNGTKIDGAAIDYTLYNFDESKNVQVISFIEFCYSYRADKQEDYGLYVYVYNPRGYDWTKNEQLNRLTLRCGGNSSGSFIKYALTYLNRSEESGKEGLFYKFRIELTPQERTNILALLNSSEPIYEVGEIELYSSGTNATSYDVSNTYKYTGYAKGYGSDSSTADTLTCKSDGLMSLTLDVHPTQYRPEGSNGKNSYTQDSLHSVYFSIPNEILNEYGGLSAVHAMWLNAVTAKGLVTGNYDAYVAVKQFIGRNVKDFSGYKGNTSFSQYPYSDLDYAFISEYGYDRFGSSKGAVRGRTGYNFHWDYTNVIESELERLDYVFYSGDDADSADKYVVSSEELSEWFEYYTRSVPVHSSPSTDDGEITTGAPPATRELVNGKYDRRLFSSVDETFTELNIHATDKFSLTSEKLDQDLWEKIFGGSHAISSTTFDNIAAIYPVTDKDFKSNTSLTCKELYISESDYLDFKAYYDLSKIKNETLFLFRYQVSDYVSEECSEVTEGDKANNTNAYFFQETVNLDFDIIDVTCSKGEVDTVIPVIMSPIDIIPDITPPLDVTPDKPKTRNLVKLILAIVMLIVLLIVFAPLLPPLFSAVVWIIKLPFRAIGAVFKAFRKKE